MDQAERRYRQPLCARHPYRRPLRRLGRGRRVEYPSLMAMLALVFGSVKRLAYANLTDRATYAKRLALAESCPIAGRERLLIRQSQFMSR